MTRSRLVTHNHIKFKRVVIIIDHLEVLHHLAIAILPSMVLGNTIFYMIWMCTPPPSNFDKINRDCCRLAAMPTYCTYTHMGTLYIHDIIIIVIRLPQMWTCYILRLILALKLKIRRLHQLTGLYQLNCKSMSCCWLLIVPQ